MGLHSIRMPDIGEGIAETEIAEWLVTVGQQVREDDPLVAVMTDKATVEIPSPVAGRVVWLAGAPGDMIAVGAEMIRLEAEAGEDTTPMPEAAGAMPTAAPAGSEAPRSAPPSPAAPLWPEGEKPLAPPSVRAKARAAGVDLRMLRGSGPSGRITHADLDAFIFSGSASGSAPGTPPAGLPTAPAPGADPGVEEIRVIGLRRKIAERMEIATHIPHITIVEEIDATAIEDLRQRMNAGDGARLTLLPFVARAMMRALREQPMLNAHYDAPAGLIRRFDAVHLGIATQTPSGLMVPVLHHAEALGLREIGAGIVRLAEAARNGTVRREELIGSTITITSLGSLGAIASTPILNVPEVAIIGINRLAIRPFWNGSGFEPRRMMNLSCSFDHRIIDGWDAAIFVARLKELLETPALIFMEN
ncbi:MAG: 2-oxo acid dehydrogenase subunit E2 [Gemmobacter sp.]|jgi:2-oxoisovalerate dehydrogenase E2 component (dihydrolipoyl transacylase)|nr:2-oxo acid dehydrogenase subunit E2 [Gemmobacter sp.]